MHSSKTKLSECVFGLYVHDAVDQPKPEIVYGIIGMYVCEIEKNVSSTWHYIYALNASHLSCMGIRQRIYVSNCCYRQKDGICGITA